MEINITIRFYEELNDFLEPCIRKQDLSIDTKEGNSVGNLIESMGIPRSSVNLVLVNGHSAGFDRILQENDRVSVYPMFERFNIGSVSVLEHSPLRELTFLCDVHLGRLTKYLRMLGFDTWYNNDYDDNNLIYQSNRHHRILLSRSKKLTKSKKLLRRYLVNQTDPVKQIREIITYFDLKKDIAPMSRCLECNDGVKPIAKEAVKHRVDELIFEINDEYTECKGCGRLYWKGSHYDSMMRWIRKILN